MDNRNRRLKEELFQKVKQEKLYLHNDLDAIREELATCLGVPAICVDGFIKDLFNCSLRDFINNCRVARAKALLESPRLEEKKIIEIAFETGFGSLRAFNANFKGFTGYTPTEYRAFQKNFRKYIGLPPEEFDGK